MRQRKTKHNYDVVAVNALLADGFDCKEAFTRLGYNVPSAYEWFRNHYEYIGQYVFRQHFEAKKKINP